MLLQLLNSLNGFCQNAFYESSNSDPLEKLRKENAKLKKENELLMLDTSRFLRELKLCSLYENSQNFAVLSSNKKLKVNVIEVKGNSINNTISLEYLLSYEGSNQVFELHSGTGRPVAYDGLGGILNFKNAFFDNNNSSNSFGLKTVSVLLPSEVKVKGVIVFNGLSESVKVLKLIRLEYYLRNPEGDFSGSYETHWVEIRDVKVDW